MTTESDNLNAGFLATIIFGGTFLTITAILAMQGLSMQSDGWEFKKKYADVPFPDLIATNTEGLESLKKIERLNATTVVVPIEAGKSIVVRQLRGK